MAVNQQKIDLKAITDKAVSDYIEIEESDAPQRIKTQKQKRLGASIQKALHGDKRKLSKHKVKLVTLNRYMTIIRKAIAKTGYKHHDFDKQIDKAIKAQPEYKNVFESWRNKPLLEVRSALTQWRKDIKPMMSVKEWSKEKDKAESLFNTLALIKPNPPIFQGMALKASDAASFAMHQESKINQKQSELVELELETVKNATIDLLTTNENNPKQAELIACGIALATGRRQVEICLQGSFKIVKGSDYKLKFEGQAKAKGEKGAYIIPTLAPAKTVIEAIKTLRESDKLKTINDTISQLEDDQRNTEFNNLSRTFTAQAKLVFQKYFGKKPTVEGDSLSGNWQFKDSRAIYAKTAFLLYEVEQDKQGLPVSDADIFFTKNLGHTDKKAKDAYKAFRIKAGGEASRIEKDEVKEAKQANKARPPEARIDGLKSFAKTKEISSSKTLTKYMDKLIPLVEQNPDIEITQTWLRKEVKGKAINLKKLFELLDKQFLIRV